jgi:hypothetical protein
MSLTFKYNLSLKRGESKILELPNLKSSGLLLKQFSLVSDHKSFDIKLYGKDNILSYGEAVFYQATAFDLSDQVAQIIESDILRMGIKNLSTGKDASTVSLTVVLNYDKTEGNIIYNNTYTNLNPDGLQNIMEDIKKAGKYITKIVWTSPNKLSSLEFRPQFESEPKWLEPIIVTANKNNQIVIDLSDERYDPDFISQLKYYVLGFSDNIEKLGLIIYGYVN